MTPAERARALFEMAYSDVPGVVESAPGRVNIIGEHTDYNGGYVLPAALPQRTAVALRLNESGHFHSISEQFVGDAPESFDGPVAAHVTHLDYLRGVRQVLADRGLSVPGMDIAIASDVPVGSGLSSSAALLVASLRAVTAALHASVEAFDLARLAHRAEHDYVGVRVGVMDPMASSLAQPGTALLLNARTLVYELIPFPIDLELAVVDSGQQHQHASGEYGKRRAECEAAAKALGVAFLCDLDPDRHDTSALSPTLRARVSHVVSENRRVQLAVAALHRSGGHALGQLLNQSHASLRDDYAVSTPEIDRLVSTAQNIVGCLGARMTGGGFGGSIVILTRRGDARRVADATVTAYAAHYPDSRARVVVPLPEPGAAA